MSPVTPARVYYQLQLQQIKVAYDRLHRQHMRMVWIRTACFVVALLGLLLGYNNVGYRVPQLVVGWSAALGFLVAIVRHEHIRLGKLRCLAEQQLLVRLLARLDRDWSQLPDQPLLPEFQHLACADDLDVAGGASLLALLSLAGTVPGKRALQGWIAGNTDWTTVQARQRATQQLTEHRELRLSIIKVISANSDGDQDVYRLPHWAASPPWLPRHRLAHALSYLGPALIALGGALLIAALATGNKSFLPNVGVGLLGGGLLLNILVTVFWGSWIHDIFQQVTGSHQAAFQFQRVFESLAGLPADGGLLDDIRRTATEEPTCATQGFEKLLWRVRLANLQRDPLMYVVYLGLQLTILWDFRVLKSLEKWQGQFGPHVSRWFEALGTSEAIISTATLADEHPSWAYPKPLSDATLQLATSGLGHPLLPDTARVDNDLRLAADRPLLLVTGSNMAGKSTFLRSLGLNLLLARCGAPVCASRMETPLYELATSIRVRDSLRDGVSFFMAELQLLKSVVDLAHSRSSQTDSTQPNSTQDNRELPASETAKQPLNNPILFLLDEILQGTNSRERQLAVATVVQRLLGYGACGLLSTHDLDLATVDSIESVSQVVHFHEYFKEVDGKEVMCFDYKMRPGSTPTTNALKLLKMVGLE